MISLDEQIADMDARCRIAPSDENTAILLSLRRLKRIEELMREPSQAMIDAAQMYDYMTPSQERTYSDCNKAMSAALLKQVEEEVK